MMPGTSPVVTPNIPPAFSGLTFKGRGVKSLNNTIGNIVADYGSVTEGSAPAAGDLVVWLCQGVDDTNVAIADLTGLGWAQTRATAVLMRYALQAKVLTSGDVASPPVLISASAVSKSLAAGWIAYTVSGSAPTVAMGTLGGVYTGTSAPPNQAVDSSALNPPAVGITAYIAGGDDNTITVTGIVPDKSEQMTDVGFGTYDLLFGWKLDVGGAAYTIVKADDGGQNSIVAGYVSAS